MAGQNVAPLLVVGAGALGLGLWWFTRQPVYTLGQVVGPGMTIARVEKGLYWIEFSEQPGVLYGPYTGRQVRELAAAYA